MDFQRAVGGVDDHVEAFGLKVTLLDGKEERRRRPVDFAVEREARIAVSALADDGQNTGQASAASRRGAAERVGRVTSTMADGGGSRLDLVAAPPWYCGL